MKAGVRWKWERRLPSSLPAFSFCLRACCCWMMACIASKSCLYMLAGTVPLWIHVVLLACDACSMAPGQLHAGNTQTGCSQHCVSFMFMDGQQSLMVKWSFVSCCQAPQQTGVFRTAS